MKPAIILLLWSFASGAQTSGPLTLKAYLEQVKSGSPEGRAAVEAVVAAEQRLNEADGSVMPEFYASYFMLDDQKETAQPNFMGTETKATDWKLGLRQKTLWGLSGDLSFQSTHTNMAGVSAPLLPDYTESRAVLALRQSLWRNAFGDGSQAEYEAYRARNRGEWLKRRMDLKNILLNAENTYWGLVSMNQIIKLQQENMERLKATRNRMGNKARLRLYDDVDAMQAEAAFQNSELDLQKSLDDRDTLVRQFNTLRGRKVDTVESLESLPEKEILLKMAHDPNKPMSREDLQGAFEAAKNIAAKARASRAQIRPQLDLIGSVTSSGRDVNMQPSYDEVGSNKNPGWQVGVEFSVSLDFGLLSDLRRSYHAEERVGQQQIEMAKFNENRIWNDLVQKKKDAQVRYEKTLSIEKIMSELVKRDRLRLINGRTTTFQNVVLEEKMAGAQIKRLEAQLRLIEVHNLVKTFAEEKP